MKQISKEDSSAGYDILSYEIDGTPKFIEVKSTISENPSQMRFFISENEVSKAINEIPLCYGKRGVGKYMLEEIFYEKL